MDSPLSNLLPMESISKGSDRSEVALALIVILLFVPGFSVDSAWAHGVDEYFTFVVGIDRVCNA